MSKINFRIRQPKITVRYIASQFQPIFVKNGWIWADSNLEMYIPGIIDIEEMILRLINTVKDTNYRSTSCGRITVKKDKKNNITASLGKQLTFSINYEPKNKT